MGLKALTRIAPRLLAALPHEDIHVTAVSQVSAATQQTCCAPLREIEAALRQRPLPTPVVFILGQSARPLPLREVAKIPLSSCHE
jgi:siroheme synthase